MVGRRGRGRVLAGQGDRDPRRGRLREVPRGRAPGQRRRAALPRRAAGHAGPGQAPPYSVVDVLGEHPEAVEADLCHHYAPRDPIGEFWRGEITLRQLRVLVEGLPPDGALARAAAGHHWRQADFHAADQLDALLRLLTDFRNANRAETAPALPYPDPVWRPTDPSPKQRKRAERRERQEARAGYQRLVSQLTPQYAEKG
ncbi:predicted protein [Streptomyces sp. SPB78]|nr:predicted protein [Streptomyces sp. SPB78]